MSLEERAYLNLMILRTRGLIIRLMVSGDQPRPWSHVSRDTKCTQSVIINSDNHTQHESGAQEPFLSRLGCNNRYFDRLGHYNHEFYFSTWNIELVP